MLALSGINALSVLNDIVTSFYKDLSFLNKLLWINYRLGLTFSSGTLNYDALVFYRNLEFLFFKDISSVAASTWFGAFFLVNLIFRITAD